MTISQAIGGTTKVAPRQQRLTPPTASTGIIDRPRLTPLIDGRPVVVLAGMAGYGKSTLLAAAAHRQPQDGATVWMTLDDADKDPAHLVADLLEATARADI